MALPLSLLQAQRHHNRHIAVGVGVVAVEAAKGGSQRNSRESAPRR